MSEIEITLSFFGQIAEANEINFYDVSQALVGFQRSLALTTHLVLNGEIITQAPALKGAEIIAFPPAAGSWKFSAAIVALATGLYQAGTAPKDTPLGHLVRSAYDYVISESLGFHVDYEKTLGQQYEELKKTKQIGSQLPIPQLPISKLDSLVEKCENSIKEIHRPIVKSETASKAKLSAQVGHLNFRIGPELTSSTYEFIAYTERSSDDFIIIGKVTSYNINTFKGRVYVNQEHRPIPFELADMARDIGSVSAITASLQASARQRLQEDADIKFRAYRNESRTGRLKALYIIEIL